MIEPRIAQIDDHSIRMIEVEELVGGSSGQIEAETRTLLRCRERNGTDVRGRHSCSAKRQQNETGDPSKKKSTFFHVLRGLFCRVIYELAANNSTRRRSHAAPSAVSPRSAISW